MGLIFLARLGIAASVVPPPYRIDVWKTEEGLPQSSVTSIIQTRDGYLWLGTFGGLARFDGVSFKTFNGSNIPRLPSGRILSLFEDQHGVLWAGTEGGEVVQFASAGLKVYSPPNAGTVSRYVQAFAETPDGLWLKTAENQLIRLAAGKFTVISTNWSLSGTLVYTLAKDESGRIWIGTDKELAYWENGQFVPAWDQNKEDKFAVDFLAAGQRAGLWVVGNGRVRKFQDGKWVSDYGEYTWTKGVVTCMHEDRESQLWIGTYGSGLFCYPTNGSVMHLSRKQGLPGKAIRSFYEDREGNLWAGTEGEGLVRLKKSIFTSFSRAEGLANDLVSSVCEGEDGELWIGTNGEGVDRLKDGEFKHYGSKEGLTNEYVWSVLVDHNKTLWAGTWGGGLFRLNADRFNQFQTDEATPASGVVYGLYEDSKDRLWLGQFWNRPAVTYLCADKPSVSQLPTRSPRVDARVIVEDREGNIWVGTIGDGLYRFSEGGCSRLAPQDGLLSDHILALYVDADGVLWIGTNAGLNRMEKGKFTAFTTKDGLEDNVICCILEDNRRHLWFSSGKGVFHTSRDELNGIAAGNHGTLRCLRYTKADGLPSLECSSGCQPAGCKTRDGRLWFPTVGGLAMVDPENAPFNPLPPPVMIEKVIVEGTARGSTFDLSPLSEHSKPAPSFLKREEAGGPLIVPPGKQRFEFQFTGLSFTAPEKMRFKYKLERLEKDWVEAGAVRTAQYSYLPPGSYQFRVMACNNDNVWNETGASLAIVLLPYFWQTGWFRVLAATGIILLFVLAYEIRLASVQRLARLRLRIARDLHDEVGSNLGSIALLGELLQKESAPVGSAGPSPAPAEISEIRRIAVQTIESLRDIVWFLDPGNDNMADLVLRMKETARTMLPGIPFEFKSVGEDYSGKPSLELRRNLSPIFKEILHNIARHARATQVKIEVEIQPPNFQLRVTDNGIGFDELHVQPGNGLRNLRRRTADLAGKITIVTHPGAGTVVLVQAHIT